MKKFFTTIALLSAATTVSLAQTGEDPIDMEAVIFVPVENQAMPQNGPLDTNKVLCLARCNTAPSVVDSGQALLFYSSMNAFPTTTTVTSSGVVFLQDINIPAIGNLFRFPNDQEIGAGHTGPFVLSADSITNLCDWNEWQNGIFKLVARNALVPGQAYGFFFKVMGIRPLGAAVNVYRDDPNFETGDAAQSGNNRTAVKVIWGQGTSIGDMLAKKDQVSINLYPNPSRDIIHFDFEFKKASHATAVVRDITGKVVITKNFGRALIGTQKYALDISALNTGNYMLQFDTDEKVAVAKFAVKK